jgi:hypothetical protein
VPGWKTALFDNVEHGLVVRQHICPTLVDASGLREDRQILVCSSVSIPLPW